MKYWATGVLILLCGCGPSTEGEAPTRTDVSESTEVIEHELFESTEGKFSIRFPGEPTMENTPLVPGKVAGQLYIFEEGDEAFAVNWSQFAVESNDVNREFDLAREYYISTWNGTLVRQSTGTVQDLPSQEIVMDIGDGVFVRAIILFNARYAYQIQMGGPEKSVSSAAADAYFASFKMHPR